MVRFACLAVAMLLAPWSSDATDVAAPAVVPPPAADGDVALDELLQGTDDLQTIPVEPVREEAAESKPTAQPRSRMVEEIIVTAQKREENVQDVPISVQAFSAEALDARGITDVLSLPSITPGMVYSVIAGFSVIYIRGIGTDAFLPSADASISTYIDGIFFPYTHGLVQSFGAVERIEVLKGPQGTLFGRNSTGGAINVTTRKPTDSFEGSLQTSFGSFNERSIRAYLNIPLSDSFFVNVSGLYKKADPYYSLSPQSPLDAGALELDEETGVRVRARWLPSDSLEMTLTGLLVEQTGTGSSVNQNTNPNLQYRPLGATETPPHQTSADYRPFLNLKNPTVYGEVSYFADWLDIKLLSSYQDTTTSAGIDYDATRAPLVAFSAEQMARVRTHELQLISNESSFGSDWMTWIGGIYHIASRAGYDEVMFSVGRELPAFGTVLGALVNPERPLLGLAGLTRLLGGTLSGLGTSVDINAMGYMEVESTAFYTQSTIQLPYDIALTLGGRYQVESREMKSSRDQLQLTDTVFIPLFDFRDQRADLSNFSPKIALDYRLTDDVMTYASYQRGFKSGTFNILNIYTPTQYVEPETVKAVEVGIKSRLFDQRLQFNAALFRTDIEDMQVQFLSLLSGGAVRFETAKGARISGVDLDLIWEVAPSLLPGLVATANGAFLDAEYTDYPGASGFTDTGVPFGGTGLVVGGGVLPGRDFSGNRIVRSPEFSGTVGLSYTFDALDGTFEVAADLYHNSGYFYSAQNIASAEESAYELLDARISYWYAPLDLRVTLFGKNLTDTVYALNRLPTDIGTWTTYAPPQIWGVRVQWEF